MINSRSRALQSPKQIQKKRNKLIITSSLIFLCSIIFIILIILFFRLAFLQISNIIVNGNPTIAFSEIENETYLTFNGEYLNIIPRSSSIFYSKSKIEKNLIDKFKKIDSLNIKQKGISTLEINIKEKETVAVVCDGFHDDDLQSADQKCYSVDKNGYVFEESVILSESVYPHYYIDLSKNTNIIGSNFIDNKMFLDLQNFINIIQNSHISVIGILIGENDQYELYGSAEHF